MTLFVASHNLDYSVDNGRGTTVRNLSQCSPLVDSSFMAALSVAASGKWRHNVTFSRKRDTKRVLRRLITVIIVALRVMQFTVLHETTKCSFQTCVFMSVKCRQTVFIILTRRETTAADNSVDCSLYSVSSAWVSDRESWTRMWYRSLKTVTLLVVSGVLASFAHQHGNAVGEWVQIYTLYRKILTPYS